MLNSEFICVIGTVTSYLGNWGKRINFGNDVAEIQQKYEREREKVGERKSGNAIAEIGEIFFFGDNCDNAITENRRKKNNGCRNLGRN